MNVFTNDFIMNVFTKLIWEWSYTFNADLLGLQVYVHFLCSSNFPQFNLHLSSSTLWLRRVRSFSMQQQQIPKWNYALAAAPLQFQVNLHLLCSSSTSTYTIKQQQQVQSYIRFGSSNNLAVVVKVYFFIYIYPHIL